ncbi:MAG: serine/threonine protein kinase [Acidobacteria bacterium]|nr:serine/threonine protein kinase [Acidobacteriota bacterium]
MAANPNLGRFRILRELGRGAMGVVYLAEDPAIGRFVAVKMINLEALSEPGEARLLRDRLVREARSAGILSHPSIVTIYDIHSTEAGSSIVMEFVEGVTLFDKMHRGRLEKREALSILAQTAAALDYAHSKGVLHRDIKPANLMVNSAGLVKITDFGVARLISQKTATSNMVLGTPCYMSPEQIANKPIGPATDQFALAVVAFELLSGSKPFAADSVSSLLYNIVYQAPASICQLNPALPGEESPGALRLLQRLCERHPCRLLRTTPWLATIS